MKKLIHLCLILFALVSAHCIAAETASDAKAEPSYACKVMQERGSIMFCPVSNAQSTAR